MNLTQLSSIKARLKIDLADTTDDALLQAALSGLSARLQNDCNRKFDRQAGATFQFNGNALDILVDRYPIEAVTAFALKSTEAEGFLVQSPVPDFVLSETATRITLLNPLGSHRQIGRVTYTGGYVLPGTAATTGQTALPDDLEQAVIEQLCYWYQRRNQLGLTSASGDGGTLSFFRTLDLLPSSAAVFKRYERIIF